MPVAKGITSKKLSDISRAPLCQPDDLLGYPIPIMSNATEAEAKRYLRCFKHYRKIN